MLRTVERAGVHSTASPAYHRASGANGAAGTFLAGAALRPNITKPGGLDVFLTSMSPGVARKQGTKELTLAASTGNPGASPSIESLALSQDGLTGTAFTSPRDNLVFPENGKRVGGFSVLHPPRAIYM